MSRHLRVSADDLVVAKPRVTFATDCSTTS